MFREIKDVQIMALLSCCGEHKMWFLTIIFRGGIKRIALQFEQPIFVFSPPKIDEKTDTICLLKGHATKFTLLLSQSLCYKMEM